MTGTTTEPPFGSLHYLANAIADQALSDLKRLAPDTDEIAVIEICDRIRESITSQIRWAAESRNWWMHQLAANARGENPTGGVHRVDGWVVCCSDCGTVMVEQHDTGWRVIEYATKADAYEGADGGDPTGFLMFQDPTVCDACAIRRPDLMDSLEKAAGHFRAEFMVDEEGVTD